MPPSKRAPDAAPVRRTTRGARESAELELPAAPPARSPAPRAGRPPKSLDTASALRHPDPRAIRIPNFPELSDEGKPRAGRSAKPADTDAHTTSRPARPGKTAYSPAETRDHDNNESAWPEDPRRSTLLKEGRGHGRLGSAASEKATPSPAPRSRAAATPSRVTASAHLVSPPTRATPARPLRKRAAAAKAARAPRRRSLVPTEAGLLWGLLYDLLCAPLWLINLLRGRAKWRDGLRPVDRLQQFALSARMTALLVTLNLLVFAFEIYTRHAGWSRAAFVAHFALSTDGLGRGEQLPLLTHFFAHASPIHLGGNMLALFVFGRVVERNLGPWRLLACYLLAAVCSTALSLLAQGLSGRSVPTLGASGAVAGLVALGILLEPLTLTFEALVPMPLFLVGWLAMAADFAALLGPGAATDPVDHPAHLGGYLSVLLCYYALKQKHQQQARLGLWVNLATLLLMAGMWFFWGSRGG